MLAEFPVTKTKDEIKIRLQQDECNLKYNKPASR